MGVSDYTCSVCGPPQGYACGEATGDDCDVVGFGNDEAFLELLFFTDATAPAAPGDVLAARPRATSRRIERWGYDWGDWEFVPSLNYRELLMGDGDPRGIWRVIPFDPDHSDGHPVEVDVPSGQVLWVVAFCPTCHEVFVQGKPPPGGPCRLHLEAIAEHLSVELDEDDKAGATATVAALLSPSASAPKTATTTTKKKKPAPKKKPSSEWGTHGLSQPLFSEALKQKLMKR